MIPEAHLALWEQLDAFELDEPEVRFAFSDRLARENGWSPPYTRRVIQEYKRFLFLAVVAGHPVTPSVEVNQAWHLHLTYTRSYWERLCGQLLQHPLHHEPTRGGNAEQGKFNDWYARTLSSYENFFDTPPPTDIWLPPALRFSPKGRVRQVSEQTHWVIPKPAWPWRRLLIIVLPLALLLVACVTWEENSWSWTIAATMGGLFVFFLAYEIAVRWWRRTSGRGKDRQHGDTGGCGSSCGSSDGGSDGGDGCSSCSGCGGCGGCGG
ncbi:MAG: hypothetical protein H0T73_01810 [Ardenticatenales bacterium]|nr:hypothetical protein [Ardenticatenales bacterium]